MRVSREALVMAAVAAACATVGVAPAGAVPRFGRGVVQRVDGPARVSVAFGSRVLRVHMVGVDAPESGECGAAQSKAALRTLATGKSVRFELPARAHGKVAKDVGGRIYARLTTRSSDLATALAATGWARLGVRVQKGRAVGPAAETWVDDDATTDGLGTGGGAMPTTGVWAVCGGRMHLPAGQAAAASAAATWTTDAHGALTAIGAITVPAAATAALTVPRLAATVAGGEEITDGNGACYLLFPALRAAVVGFTDPTRTARRCTSAVRGFQTYGPGAFATDRGLATGAAATAIPGLYGELSADDAADTGLVALPLGSVRSTAPWEVWAHLDRSHRVTGFSAGTVTMTGG